jgi:hypothetical protein
MLRQTKSAGGVGGKIRLWPMLFGIVPISVPLAAQAPPANLRGTGFQSWDELDALTRLSSRLDVTWIA